MRDARAPSIDSIAKAAHGRRAECSEPNHIVLAAQSRFEDEHKFSSEQTFDYNLLNDKFLQLEMHVKSMGEEHLGVLCTKRVYNLC